MDQDRFVFEVILRHVALSGIYTVNKHKDSTIKEAIEVWQAIKKDSISRQSEAE